MLYDDLKAFLVDLPSRLDYKHPNAVRQNLYKALYYSATNGGQYLDELFEVSEEEKERLSDYGFPITSLIEKKPFFSQSSRHETHSHPRGKACARVFKRGEPVYRCEDCGFDDTCVLCKFCFNREDHVNHNVNFYTSSGSNGGICDCGDPEAFVNELHCKSQQGAADEDILAIEQDFNDAINLTIKTCLGYILDVMNFSVHTLPFIHQNINSRGDLKFSTKQISDFSSLPYSTYGAADINSENLWYLILWNDERHDYEEAQHGIRAATNCDNTKAQQWAHEINNVGRCVLKNAPSYSDLLPSQKSAEADGLVATIMSARDYMRELIVEQIVNWLIEVTNFSASSSFRENCKENLSELLLEPNFEFSKLFPMEFLSDTKLDIKRACFESGFLYDGQLVDLGSVSVRSDIEFHQLMSPTKNILESGKQVFSNSRLQYLLAFDIRFTSQVRKKLSKLLISPLVADSYKKERFAEQFVTIYPNLINIYALSDREEALNLVAEITTQLFTCPKTVSTILLEDRIGNILGPVAQLIEEQSTKVDPFSGYPHFIEIVSDLRSKRKNYSKKVAIMEGIRSVLHLVDKSLPQVNKLEVFLSRDNLIMLLLFLRNFQGFWPIVRKYGEHVEREVLDFIIHANYSVHILNIVKNITDCPANDQEKINDAVEIIINFLKLRKIKKHAPGIADFTVSKEPSSFINPINSLLSFLISYRGFEKFENRLIAPSNRDFLAVSDISLRSMVLGYQVKSGFWIRNGMSVSRQATMYMGSFLRDVAYFRDFFLTQLSAVVQEPSITLYNILDRWELLRWFNGEVAHNQTVYEDRFGSIIESLITLLYNILTNRFEFNYASPQDRIRHKIKMAIAYSLCDEPKAYSNIHPALDIEIGDVVDYDDILYECADYMEPTGFSGTGMYRLKDSMFEQLDPLSLYLEPSQQFQSVAESLIKNIAKVRKTDEKEVILVPDIKLSENKMVNDKVGAFTKTKHFAKLIYKLLQVAIDNSDETFLPQLLHLIHAVLKDDELIHGPNYLNDHFVTIPISDLLLTLVESTMSSHVIFKADHIIGILMQKDQRIVESLIDCFGEDHIQTYKRRKAAASETEAEKRRQKADQRKAKVMKKFAKQREKFLKKNIEFADHDNDTENKNSEDTHGLRTCVSCGDPESIERPFGVFMTKVESSAFWKTPKLKQHQQRLPWLKGLHEVSDEIPWPDKYPYMDATKNNGMVAFSCGHGMHVSCYRTLGRGSVYCPLCHSLSNLFIPSFIAPKTGGGLPDDFITSERINDRYSQIVISMPDDKKCKLFDKLVHEDYTNAKTSTAIEEGLALVRSSFLKAFDNSKPLHGYVGNMEIKTSALIADTIRANELASRFDCEHLGSFLDTMSPSTKSFLKNLIQCRALMQRSSSDSLPTSEQSREIESFWNSPDGMSDYFNEVVQLFFQTEESLTTIAHFAYVKLISVIVFYYSEVEVLTAKGKAPPFKYPSEGSSVMEKLIQTVTELTTTLNIKSCLSCPEELFFTIQRFTLPFLRRVWIFKCLLVSKDQGDHVHVLESGADKFDVLGEPEESSDDLCDAIGLPKLADLLESIFDPTNRSSFEYRTFDLMYNAKIPTSNVALDYPGLVELVHLPTDYNECIVNYASTFGASDHYVCLHCNGKTTQPFNHCSKCFRLSPIFFSPRYNLYRVFVEIDGARCLQETPGHYLTKHGEVKRDRSKEKATLNKDRYIQLNKMWLNQSLYGLVTRATFGTRQPPTMPGGMPNFTNIGDMLNFEEEDGLLDDEEFMTEAPSDEDAQSDMMFW